MTRPSSSDALPQTRPLDLDRVHWDSFGLALRLFMKGFGDDDNLVAKSAGVPAGAVRRARCHQRVALLNFKRLCAFMDRAPSDFIVDALPASGLLERDLPADSTSHLR